MGSEPQREREMPLALFSSGSREHEAGRRSVRVSRRAIALCRWWCRVLIMRIGVVGWWRRRGEAIPSTMETSRHYDRGGWDWRALAGEERQRQTNVVRDCALGDVRQRFGGGRND